MENYEQLVKSIYPNAYCFRYDNEIYKNNYTILSDMPELCAFKKIFMANKYLCNWKPTSDMAWKEAYNNISNNIQFKLEN